MVKQDVGIFEYRGIVITIETDDENAHLTYIARAGGRSLITMGWSGECAQKKVIDGAHKKIDDAYTGSTEKMTLWLNDTTHWMSENKDLVVPVMLSVRGIASVLEEVLKMSTGLSPQLRHKAEQTIERVKKEL